MTDKFQRVSIGSRSSLSRNRIHLNTSALPTPVSDGQIIITSSELLTVASETEASISAGVGGPDYAVSLYTVPGANGNGLTGITNFTTGRAGTRAATIYLQADNTFREPPDEEDGSMVLKGSRTAIGNGSGIVFLDDSFYGVRLGYDGALELTARTFTVNEQEIPGTIDMLSDVYVEVAAPVINLTGLTYMHQHKKNVETILVDTLITGYHLSGSVLLVKTDTNPITITIPVESISVGAYYDIYVRGAHPCNVEFANNATDDTFEKYIQNANAAFLVTNLKDFEIRPECHAHLFLLIAHGEGTAATWRANVFDNENVET